MKLTPKMEELADKIIDDLKGDKVPWDRPWFSSAMMNWVSKKPYQGMNILSLAYGMEKMGLKVGQFMTYNQAEQEGGKVKPGSKGIPICFFTMLEGKKDPATGKADKFPLMKTAIVFGVENIEGITPRTVKARDLSPNALGDKIIKMSGADIRENQALSPAPAFCKNDGSYIEVPKRNLWKTDEAYYSTVFHELIHWTGSKDKLDRQSFLNYAGQRDLEELTAEIGAAFLASYVGFKYDTQHTAYIQSWARMIEDKKNAIYTASSHAQKAVNYLLTLAGELTPEPVKVDKKEGKELAKA